MGEVFPLLVISKYHHSHQYADPQYKRLVQFFDQRIQIIMFDTILLRDADRYSKTAQLMFYGTKSIIFKGSSDTSHFIFEINVGKRWVRQGTTLKLNF